MKLVNRTDYRGRDIRTLILAAFKAEGVNPRRYHVWVSNTNRARCHGRAGIGYEDVKMWIPFDWDAPAVSAERIHDFARVLIHEIGHTLGLVHRDQIAIPAIPTPWADGLVLRRKPERPQVSMRERRYENAKGKLIEHSRKLKREQNMVRKWRSKVRYYERTLGVAAGEGA